MYSHTGRNKQCERKTNTCFYSFSMKNVNTSQTGTYYCAVAACGHILFGNGTKLVCGGVFAFFIQRSVRFRGSGDHGERRLLVPRCAYRHRAGPLFSTLWVNNQPNRSMQNRQNECVYSAVRL
ncbi:hypothetical protein D4764_0192310 [Takifugu flavidus]|uniref:Immunoglobulin V-set domain-containing protein n=1 Tax=Takifugu flavidus TaxID=433684 RepID=A0A5C6MID1_9TELE|nr:hypothetical protein D4764_0192310 [Takifugu flavidus]